MDMVKLNNGQEIPVQGFGVFMVENNGPCEEAVTKALAAGCRLLDTATAYFNETDVGKAIKSSGISREEILSLPNCGCRIMVMRLRKRN